MTNDPALHEVLDNVRRTLDLWGWGKEGRDEVGEDGINHLGAVAEQFAQTLRELCGRKIMLVGHNGVGKSWIANIMLGITAPTQAEYSRDCLALLAPLPPGADARARLLKLCPNLDPERAEAGLGLGTDAVIQVAPEDYLKEHDKKDLVEFRKQFIGYVEDGSNIDTEAFAPVFLPCMGGAGSTTPVLIQVEHGYCALVAKWMTKSEMEAKAWQWPLQYRETGTLAPSSDKDKAFKAFFEAMVSDETKNKPLVTLSKKDIKIKPEILARFAGKELVFCGRGENIHNDSKFVGVMLKQVLAKDADSEMWATGLHAMTSCRLFFPCGIVEGGGKLTDGPGVGESNPFLRMELTKGLNTHDVVLVVSPRDMNASEATTRFLRQSQFLNNLVEHPSKYHLAYMHYRENTERVADRDQLLGRTRGGLKAVLDACKTSTVQSIRALLADKCAEMNIEFTEEIGKSWTFGAAYPTLMAGLLYAGKTDDPEGYEGEPGTSLLSEVLRDTRRLLSISDALEMQDGDNALEALRAGWARGRELFQPPPRQGVFLLDQDTRDFVFRKVKGMQKHHGRTLARKSEAGRLQQQTLISLLEEETIVFKDALEKTVRDFFENNAGIFAKRLALQNWVRPQLPANIERTSLLSWFKGADPSIGPDGEGMFQLGEHLLGKFRARPIDFSELLESLEGCVQEACVAFKAVAKTFMLETLKNVMSDQGVMWEGVRESLEEEIELLWERKIESQLKRRTERFLKSGVTASHVSAVNLQKWYQQADEQAIVDFCKRLETNGEAYAGTPKEVVRKFLDAVMGTILPNIMENLKETVLARVMKLHVVLSRQFKNDHPRADNSGNPSMVRFVFDLPTFIIRRILSRKVANEERTADAADARLAELRTEASDLEKWVTATRDERPEGVEGRMNALLEEKKRRWQEGANFSKLEEMLPDRFDRGTIVQNGTRFTYVQSSKLQPGPLRIAALPISTTATPFELPSDDPMIVALARVGLKLGPSTLGLGDVCSSLFYVLLQGEGVEDPVRLRLAADHLRVWLALNIWDSNSGKRAEAFRKRYGKDLKDYTRMLALTFGDAQLSGDEVSIEYAAIYQPDSALAIDVWIAGKDRPFRIKRPDRLRGEVVNIALMSCTEHVVAFRAVGSERRTSSRCAAPPGLAALQHPLDLGAMLPRLPQPIQGAGEDQLLYLILDAGVLARVGVGEWKDTFERLYREQRGCVRLFIHRVVHTELQHLRDDRVDKATGLRARRCLNFFIEDFCFGGRTPKWCEKLDSGFVVLQSDHGYKDSTKTWPVYGLSVANQFMRGDNSNDTILRAFADHCVFEYGRGKVVMVTDDVGFQQDCRTKQPPHNQTIQTMACFGKPNGRPRLSDMWNETPGGLKARILRELQQDGQP